MVFSYLNDRIGASVGGITTASKVGVEKVGVAVGTWVGALEKFRICVTVTLGLSVT